VARAKSLGESHSISVVCRPETYSSCYRETFDCSFQHADTRRPWRHRAGSTATGGYRLNSATASAWVSSSIRSTIVGKNTPCCPQHPQTTSARRFFRPRTHHSGLLSSTVLVEPKKLCGIPDDLLHCGGATCRHRATGHHPALSSTFAFWLKWIRSGTSKYCRIYLQFQIDK
jgi:hypothetical protein